MVHLEVDLSIPLIYFFILLWKCRNLKIIYTHLEKKNSGAQPQMNVHRK